MSATSIDRDRTEIRTALAHRGHLATVLRPDPTLIERIGGRSVIACVIDGLYDRIENDPDLRPMFTRTLTSERMKQKAFLEEWMGGEPGYTHHHAYGGMRNRHGHIHITSESAERWLAHMTASLREHVGDEHLVNEVLSTLGPLARGLVNEEKPVQSPRQLRCHREKILREPAKMAARGQVEALERSLDEDPAVLNDPRHGATILVEAALRGHTRIAALLLDRGVDVNLPAAHSSDIMMTAHCAALSKKKDETADFLLDRGAVYDVFSACFLCDMDRVSTLLNELPGLVNAHDPACDFLPVTPLHHAVYGGHEHVARFLFEKGAETGVNSTPLVSYAAGRRMTSLLRLLLRRGADASRIDCGHWVLHSEISALPVGPRRRRELSRWKLDPDGLYGKQQPAGRSRLRAGTVGQGSPDRYATARRPGAAFCGQGRIHGGHGGVIGQRRPGGRAKRPGRNAPVLRTESRPQGGHGKVRGIAAFSRGKPTLRRPAG